ncbi:MAG TPA: EthD family reductase [Mucilaginibacter sp.]|jgi:uncharacterized protein (TIGR02118 family)|nr:EthD family reductase [Mucilaginibacter sp.]
MVKLIVLYPPPADVEKFDRDYQVHLQLTHEKTGIPVGVKPYTVTKLSPLQEGSPYFYQMFSLPFESMEELQAALANPAMQELGADAHRISTGGLL